MDTPKIVSMRDQGCRKLTKNAYTTTGSFHSSQEHCGMGHSSTASGASSSLRLGTHAVISQKCISLIRPYKYAHQDDRIVSQAINRSK